MNNKSKTETKDANGTIIGVNKKAPFGYGPCSTCGRKNIHRNSDGTLKEHGNLLVMAMCTGGAR